MSRKENRMQAFGTLVWAAMLERPFGSLTKREMELILIGKAIESGMLEGTPVALASTFRISLTKAHGYLTDIALRLGQLDDKKAVELLLKSLKHCEIIPGGQYLMIPIHDARLRIWIERKLAMNHMNAGESIRRDLLKITPNGLLTLVNEFDGMKSPYEALAQLPKSLAKAPWVKQAKQHWKKNTKWKDALVDVGPGMILELVKSLWELLS